MEQFVVKNHSFHNDFYCFFDISISIRHKNHNMVIFISHHILAFGLCISALESDGSRADILRPRANIKCDIKVAM